MTRRIQHALEAMNNTQLGIQKYRRYSDGGYYYTIELSKGRWSIYSEKDLFAIYKAATRYKEFEGVVIKITSMILGAHIERPQ